uniref:Uncharacterized protein n=1 Tax=Anguilla anguilla TaxID=7936 RepID=A0A0E9PXE2_ANGAN
MVNITNILYLDFLKLHLRWNSQNNFVQFPLHLKLNIIFYSTEIYQNYH